ncbi:MAG TPA: hypothetical protein VL524_10650 [Gemmatimonadaceae bacterium]|nr:hypothetical protein [Gemmatimonadaceae bacterium]
MRRRRVALALLGLALCAGAPALGAQTPIVIRRAEIERSGWNRIAEFLEGAAGWAVSSVDGATFAASPDHLPQPGESAAGTAQWLVFVDDQPVQTNMFGLHLLELLPVTPGEIDSVVFVRVPAVIGGTPAPRGAMRIYTSRHANGSFARLTYEHGDETGDPGPYRYTTLQSPNLEKLGPFAHADLGYAAPSWNLDLGVHFTSLNTTDSILQSRFPGFSSQVPQDVMTVAPTLRGELHAFGRHTLLAGYGEQRGLLLVPTTTREQSLRSQATSVGIGGALDSIARTVIGYQAAVWSADVRELDSPLPFTIGHRRELGLASVDAQRAFGGATIAAGAGGYKWRLAQNGGTRTRTAAREFASVRTGGARLSLVATGVLVNGSRGTTADALGSVNVAIDTSTALTISAATMHEHPDIDGTWIDAAVLGREAQNENTRFSIGSVGFTRRLAGTLAIGVDARAEHVGDWRLADAPILPVTSIGDASPLEMASGTFAGGGVRLESVGSGVWQGSLAYDRMALASGDSSLRERVHSSPSNELRGQLAAMPVRDFRLTATVDVMDGTAWPGFGSDSATLRVPAISRIDASAEKWLWSRRLRIELLFQNLLNRPERYHPYGAQWNLRWHLMGSLVLPP